MLKVLEQKVAADESFGLPAGTLWAARPTSASRVRNRIEQILDWATVRKLREGDNPARWRGHLSKALPPRGKADAVVHHAAVPYVELPTVMGELRRREGTAAAALEFLILTGTRTSEVLGARWNEVDLEKKIWTVPGRRMKNGKEHRVPLSPRVVTLLQTARQQGHEHVFTGTDGGPLSKSALPVTLARLGRTETVHGMRSTFRDWCAERSNFQPHIVELCLAHSVGSAVEQAYRRGDLMDKRRAVMEAWAAFCESPVVEGGATVVALHQPAHGQS